MSDDFNVHSLSNLTEEELWEAVDELKSKIQAELEWREECAEEERQAKVKDIEECCKFETDDPDAELMRTDTKAFADKMAGQGMSDIEIGVHIGLLEKADRIMAIIKRKESEDE